MRLIATPRFARATKKLLSAEKEALDEAVRAIVANPGIGEVKKGDLAGVQVYKYRVKTELILLAYRVAENEDAIKLLAFGPHENFYRDLKRE
ncbi:MAG: type II toxin-antitoxin system RelE/ParE family toxin [Gammaproteobacteria bacterium]|nr:type II toxin-antitoxin system RelE/ParE family toxin [Gammaproteobacteria bacterium]